MKKLNYLVLFSVMLLFFSCKKIDELTQFTMSFEESVSIPAFTIVIDDPISYPEPPFSIETNSEAEFAKYNTSPERIEEVKLEEASLRVFNSTIANFDFLKSIHFYLSADGIEEELIASKLNIEDGTGQKLDLEVVGQDLSPFLTKEVIGIRMEIATDQTVPEEFDLQIFTEFFIDARVLGV